jgi:hypothetical protein
MVLEVEAGALCAAGAKEGSAGIGDGAFKTGS